MITMHHTVIHNLLAWYVPDRWWWEAIRCWTIVAGVLIGLYSLRNVNRYWPKLDWLRAAHFLSFAVFAELMTLYQFSEPVLVWRCGLLAITCLFGVGIIFERGPTLIVKNGRLSSREEQATQAVLRRGNHSR